MTPPSPTRAPSPREDEDILCVGEVLWDALPDGLFLGGALFNVAGHLHALHEPSTLVSRVGNDVLGDEVRRRMRTRGMPTDLLQVDSDHPTGIARVSLNEDGTPTYEIPEPAAWDAIAWTDALAERARSARAVVIGSLAQRNETSYRTIQTLCHTTDGLVVYDVNLRPPHTGRALVEPSLHLADVVKLNDAELQQVRDWFDLPNGTRPSLESLADRFSLRACCVTHGAEGASLWNDGTWSTHPGDEVEVLDTVGAGDAFLAAFLSGFLAGRSGESLLPLANRLGAFVASRSGALPAYDFDGLQDIEKMTLDEGGTPRTEQ